MLSWFSLRYLFLICNWSMDGHRTQGGPVSVFFVVCLPVCLPVFLPSFPPSFLPSFLPSVFGMVSSFFQGWLLNQGFIHAGQGLYPELHPGSRFMGFFFLFFCNKDQTNDLIFARQARVPLNWISGPKFMFLTDTLKQYIFMGYHEMFWYIEYIV